MSADPFGIVAAQELLAARLAERDAALVDMVRAGTTHKVAAEVFGLTAARVTQIVTAARDRDWQVGAASIGSAVPVTHASVRRDMLDAIHAQNLRAEAATGLNRAELRAFYGHADESVGDVVETRLTLEAASREHRARLAHEREQERSYRSRKVSA